MSVFPRCFKTLQWILPAVAVTVSVLAAEIDCRMGLPSQSEAIRTELVSARIALGERLFRDRRLSADGSTGCVSCHDPDKAFTDGRPLAQGVRGQTSTRNAPSLINVGYAPIMSWDGRRTSLEEQAVAPFTNPREQGFPDREAVLRQLSDDETYPRDFQQAFPGETPVISESHLQIALAGYLRTLDAGGSPFDRFYYGHDQQALDDKAKAGLALFKGRAGCSECHRIEETSTLLTDYRFHRIGVGMERINPRLGELAQQVVDTPAQTLDRQILADPDLAALGHFLATRKPGDIGRFRTPSLRNVAITAPYMHDGSVASLPEAVEAELYYRGLETGKPISLTPLEKQSLVSFLKSLTGCVPPAR